MSFFSSNGQVTLEDRAKSLAPIVMAVFSLCMIWFGWIGFVGSDDHSYADAALDWLSRAPVVGNSHWALRNTLVLPIAAAFAVFGTKVFPLVLPVILYSCAALATVFYVIRKYFDVWSASLAVAVFATLPVFTVSASVAGPDMPEVFFTVLSAVLFFEATQTADPRRALILAGVVAGFGWINRETVVFFLFGYFILFLIGFGVQRRLYFLMVAGFFAVVGIQWIYYGAMTGDPLYRVVTVLRTHLGVHLGQSGLGGIVSGIERASMRHYGDLTHSVLSRNGSPSVGRLWDPFLVVLVNHNFMFLYFFGIAAVVWTTTSSVLRSAAQRKFFLMFGIFALVWFTFLYFQVGMSTLPRYFLLPTVVVCMFVAVWLRLGVWRRKRSLAVLVVAFLLITNMAGIYIDNRDPLFPERALADYAKTVRGPIRTDPITATRGAFLYRVAGVSDRIVVGPPVGKQLFFFNPDAVLEGKGAWDKTVKRAAQASSYRPRVGWTEVWHRDSPRKFFGMLVEYLGLKRYIPVSIFRRLDKPNPDVFVFRP